MAKIARQVDVADLPLSDGKNVVSVTVKSAWIGESESASVEARPKGELDWEFSEEGQYYICAGIGDFALPNLAIPAEYAGYPVKEIADKAFSVEYATPNTDTYSKLFNLQRVTIPHTVERIGSNAFHGDGNLFTVTFDDSSQYYRAWFLDTRLLSDFRYYYETEDGETNGEWPGKPAVCVGNDDNGYPLYTALVPKNKNCTLKFSGIGQDFGATELSRVETTNIMALPIRPGQCVTWFLYSSPGYVAWTSITWYSVTAENLMKNYTASLGESTALPLTIEANAFHGCTFLNNLVLPDRLKTIGTFAFRGCSALKTVKFSLNSCLESVGYGAFENCTKLGTFSVVLSSSTEEDQFPYHLTNIYSEAFKNTGLRSIRIGNINKLASDQEEIQFGSSVFENCTQLHTAYLSCNAKVLHLRMFAGCTSLSLVMLPDTLERIKSEAFSGCSNLTCEGDPYFRNSLFIPYKVVEIEPYAFYGCDSLNRIGLGDHHGWFYTDQDTRSYENHIYHETFSSSADTAEVFKAHVDCTFFKLDQMVAPEVIVTNNILTITDITGIAEDFKIYVNGVHRATLNVETNKLTVI